MSRAVMSDDHISDDHISDDRISDDRISDDRISDRDGRISALGLPWPADQAPAPIEQISGKHGWSSQTSLVREARNSKDVITDLAITDLWVEKP